MKIKIAKILTYEFEGQTFVQVRTTFIGNLFRKGWTVVKGDFDRDYLDTWIPCYTNLRSLLRIRWRTPRQ